MINWEQDTEIETMVDEWVEQNYMHQDRFYKISWQDLVRGQLLFAIKFMVYKMMSEKDSKFLL